MHYARWRRLDDPGDSPLSKIEQISSTKPKDQQGKRGRPSFPVGTRRQDANGYYSMKVASTHPMCPKSNSKDGSGWVYEHRLVMSAHLGRPLEKSERVEHIDGNPSNNDIDNLEIVTLGGKRERHCRGCNCKEAPTS